MFVGNRTSNPTAGIYLNLDFVTPISGDWTVTIFDSVSTAIRTIQGSGDTVNTSWDGKNNAGVVQPDGNYSYQVESVAGGSQAAAPAKGPAIIDHSLVLSITGPTATPAYFSPNANGVQDTTTISSTFTFDGASWTLNLRNAAMDIVRTATGVGGGIAYAWDGKDGSGVVQPDGVYAAELIVTDGFSSASNSTTTVLDNTFPVGYITSPTNGQILSNVYQDGEAEVPFVGNATDLNLSGWALEQWFGTGWSTKCSGTAPVSDSTLCILNTATFTNGTYTFRLNVSDLAGNIVLGAQNNAIANFSFTLSTTAINPVNSETVTITSQVPALPPSNPAPLTVTLKVKNKSGQLVRTVIDQVSRAAGTYNDVWNGKNDAAGFIADGPYFVTATLSDGTNTAVYDISDEFLGTGGYSKEAAMTCNPQDIDPFNNRPYNCTFNMPVARTVTIIFSPLNPTPLVCDAPSFCLEEGAYRPPGTNVWRWSGLDSANVYRTDVQSMRIKSDLNSFSKNAVVVYGTRPAITVLVNGVPTTVRSGADTQTVAVDFSTFQSQPASVKFAFKNLASNSILRSVVLTDQPPGHVSWQWDVRAGNGMPVAPGKYLISATIIDALGNSETSETLTVVQE